MYSTTTIATVNVHLDGALRSRVAIKARVAFESDDDEVASYPTFQDGMLSRTSVRAHSFEPEQQEDMERILEGLPANLFVGGQPFEKSNWVRHCQSQPLNSMNLMLTSSPLQSMTLVTTEVAQYQRDAEERVEALCRSLEALLLGPSATAPAAPTMRSPRMRCPIELTVPCVGRAGERLDELVGELAEHMGRLGHNAHAQLSVAMEWLAGPATDQVKERLHRQLAAILHRLRLDKDAAEETSLPNEQPVTQNSSEPSQNQSFSRPPSGAAMGDKAKIPTVPDTVAKTIPQPVVFPGPSQVQLSMAIFDDEVVAVPGGFAAPNPGVLGKASAPAKPPPAPEASLFLSNEASLLHSSEPSLFHSNEPAPVLSSEPSPKRDDDDWIVADG